MNIAILGLGYVGCVSMAAFAHSGHTVIGVDLNADKVDQAGSGRATVIEKGLDEMMAQGHAAGRIRATSDLAEALDEADLVMLCIGTPEGEGGKPNLANIMASLEGIGTILAQRIKQGEASRFLTIAIRSTVPPGTLARAAAHIEEVSGTVHGRDFGMAANPEFLREGSAIKDFFHPPHVVIGSDISRAAEQVRLAYAGIDAPVEICSVATAELIKYVNNSFHALKVAFGNEIGRICKAMGSDSHELMNLFCKDDKLNISRRYLMPGAPYGGSCLPKDLAGLVSLARGRDIETPLLASVKPSNESLKQEIANRINAFGKKQIGILGISFKDGTDDVRNSPIVGAIEQLIGRGCTIRIFDPHVSVANLTGVNREYLIDRLPVISKLISNDLEEVISQSELIVCHSTNQVQPDAALLKGKIVYDLNRNMPETIEDGEYHGLAW